MDEKVREILSEVREIEIQSKKVVNTLFGGEYRSSFKGKGMEFHEVRKYIPGDDVRTVDWNVTARMNQPFVKRFIEERELTLMLLVDISGSGDFGSRKELKRDLIARISALLAFSAVKNNDKVGLILFSNGVEHYLPPAKGRKHILHLIRDILMISPEEKGTDPVKAVEFSQSVLSHGAIVFLISDFIGDNFKVDIIKKPFSLMAKKFDFIPVVVRDPLEMEAEFPGRIVLRDSESGRPYMFSGKEIKRKFKQIKEARDREMQRFFTSTGMDKIEITSGEDYVGAIHRFFRRRIP